MKENCPVLKAADILGKRWTILILLELYKGENRWKRYSVLKKSLMDITPKILSERLKELKTEDIIDRRVDTKNFPVKTEYALTKSGQDMVEVTKKMKSWALKWKIKDKKCERTDCKLCED